ncbi:hypothetical protein AB1N83_011152 [Pleurotus pulmonarius]
MPKVQKPQTQIRVTCTHRREGRIIVLSADGTANKFGEKSTNVVEFHSRIVKNKKQITFYISGIGTHNPSPVGRVLDMVFANSFETNILIAYKWLAENYEEGDRIFMFGFSRGAYQVRVIAGMIERVGLIYPGSTAQLPDVFKLYMSTTERSAESKPEKYEKAMRLCRTFKAAFSQPDVKVHFVGVWDTVSSIGFSRRASLPETVSGMSHVCHFRHALALDERRVRFWPEYAHTQGSNSSERGGDIKEVWFAGSHSDIGGDLLRVSYNLHEEQCIIAVAIPATGVLLSVCDRKVMVQTGGGERPINIGNQSSVSFQADGSRFATGDDYGTVKIWDTKTGTELRTFEGHSRIICSLAFSPDGSKIAAGTVDGTIRVWDTETGEDLLGAMEGHTDWVRGLAFSPNGTRLASGSDDRTVRLRDEAGKSKVLGGHSGLVWSVAFSKDHIISGSADNTIRVWDAGSGALVRVLRGHTFGVICVAFSPDFKLVASGSDDCTARLWDVSSGEVLAIYDVGELVFSISFSFDGKQVVTGSYEGKVHIWNADVLL